MMYILGLQHVKHGLGHLGQSPTCHKVARCERVGGGMTLQFPSHLRPTCNCYFAFDVTRLVNDVYTKPLARETFVGTPRGNAQHATKWPVVSVSVAAGPCCCPTISIPLAIAILHLT
jgi:hypothetical protein